ncbi:MAG: hypothetical protein PGN21_03900 [Sphingomonas paucimobilis]
MRPEPDELSHGAVPAQLAEALAALRTALVLLDEAGIDLAAIHVNQAIEIVQAGSRPSAS